MIRKSACAELFRKVTVPYPSFVTWGALMWARMTEPTCNRFQTPCCRKHVGDRLSNRTMIPNRLSFLWGSLGWGKDSHRLIRLFLQISREISSTKPAGKIGSSIAGEFSRAPFTSHLQTSQFLRWDIQVFACPFLTRWIMLNWLMINGGVPPEPIIFNRHMTYCMSVGSQTGSGRHCCWVFQTVTRRLEDGLCGRNSWSTMNRVEKAHIHRRSSQKNWRFSLPHIAIIHGKHGNMGGCITCKHGDLNGFESWPIGAEGRFEHMHIYASYNLMLKTRCQYDRTWCLLSNTFQIWVWKGLRVIDVGSL